MAKAAKPKTEKKPDQQPPAVSLDLDDAPPADNTGGGDAVPNAGGDDGHVSPAADPPTPAAVVGSGNPDSKSKRGRQGDENRPLCACCSKPGKPVFMKAVDTRPLFTWYVCPNRASKDNPDGQCPSARVKVPRPDQHQLYQKLRERQVRAGSIADR